VRYAELTNADRDLLRRERVRTLEADHYRLELQICELACLNGASADGSEIMAALNYIEQLIAVHMPPLEVAEGEE
jgi:hypothetical protein